MHIQYLYVLTSTLPDIATGSFGSPSSNSPVNLQLHRPPAVFGRSELITGASAIYLELYIYSFPETDLKGRLWKEITFCFFSHHHHVEIQYINLLFSELL